VKDEAWLCLLRYGGIRAADEADLGSGLDEAGSSVYSIRSTRAEEKGWAGER
jgi:hypothetical protein